MAGHGTPEIGARRLVSQSVPISPAPTYRLECEQIVRSRLFEGGGDCRAPPIALDAAAFESI
jgi:hypothetical protein